MPLLAAALVVLLALLPGADRPPQASPLVRWTLTADPAAVAPGGVVIVTVRGEIGEGWRMYAMDSAAGRPLQVDLRTPRGVEALGAPQQAQPRSGFDHHFASDYAYFEREVTVTQAFRVGRFAPLRPRIAGRVTYMLCNDEVCLPPREHEVALPLRVTRG